MRAPELIWEPFDVEQVSRADVVVMPDASVDSPDDFYRPEVCFGVYVIVDLEWTCLDDLFVKLLCADAFGTEPVCTDGDFLLLDGDSIRDRKGVWAHPKDGPFGLLYNSNDNPLRQRFHAETTWRAILVDTHWQWCREHNGTRPAGLRSLWPDDILGRDRSDLD